MFLINKLSDYKFTHIAHLSDLHIRPLERHEEYGLVFGKFCGELTKFKNMGMNVIVIITGDIFDNTRIFTPEQYVFCDNFFNDILKLYPLIVIPGNHDMKDLIRLDSLTPICGNKNNFFYLNKSGFYQIGDIVFSTTSLYDNSIYFLKRDMCNYNGKCIALYHGTISGSITDDGFVFKDDVNNNRFKCVDDFNGYDAVLLGDIHKMQKIKGGNNMWYSGSLIQQNFGENLKGHGFLLWNIDTFDVEFYEIDNDYGRVTLIFDNGKWVNDNIIFPKKSYIRCIVSNTIESIKNEIIGKIKDSGVTEIMNISFINDNAIIGIGGNDNIESDNIGDVLMDEIIEYKNNKIDDTMKSHLIKLHKKYMEIVGYNVDGNESYLWNPLKMEFKNLFGYSGNIIHTINFKSGITSITAPNACGKTSIINILFYAIFDDLLANPGKSKKIIDVLNNNSVSGYVKLELCYGGKNYTIEKGVTKMKNYKKLMFCDNDKNIVLEGEYAMEKLRDMFGKMDNFYKCNVLNNRDQTNDFFRLTDGEKIKYLKQSFNMDYFDLLIQHNKTELKEIYGIIDGKYTKYDFYKNELMRILSDKNNYDLDKRIIVLGCKKNILETRIRVLDKSYDDIKRNIIMEENKIVKMGKINIVELENIVKKISMEYDNFNDVYDLGNLKTQYAIKQNLLIDVNDDIILLGKLIDELGVVDVDNVDINTLHDDIVELNVKIKYCKQDIKILKNEMNKYDCVNCDCVMDENEILKCINELNKLYKHVDGNYDGVNKKINFIKKKMDKYVNIKIVDNMETIMFNNLCLGNELNIVNAKIDDNGVVNDYIDFGIGCEDVLMEIEKLKCNIVKLETVGQKKLITKGDVKNYKQNVSKLNVICNSINDNVDFVVNNDDVDKYLGLVKNVMSMDELSGEIFENVKLELLIPIKNILIGLRGNDLENKKIVMDGLVKDRDELERLINDYDAKREHNRLINEIIMKNKQIEIDNKNCMDKIDEYQNYYNWLILEELTIEKDRIVNLIDNNNMIIEYNKLLVDLNKYETMMENLNYNKNIDIEINKYNCMLNFIKFKNCKMNLDIRLTDLDNMTKYMDKIDKQHKFILFNKKLGDNMKNAILRDEMEKLENLINYECKRRKYVEYCEKIKCYKDNIIIKDRINLLREKLNIIIEERDTCRNELQNNIMDVKRSNDILNKINEYKIIIKDVYREIKYDEKYKQILELYGNMIGPKCLQSTIIKKELKKLGCSMNEILGKYTKYNIEIIYENNGIDIITNNGDKKLIIERLSTYETLILTTAFKRAMCKHINKTRSKLYIIDESVENLDRDNFDKALPELMKIILEECSHVLIVSQRDIKHITDNEIKIIKKGNVSYIV